MNKKEPKIFGLKVDALIYVGVAMMLTSPILFTFNSISDRFNFTESGQIGDTIGGVTAPIVNLLGALLVYISFKEQRRANDFLATDNSLRLLFDLIHELKEDIDRFQFATLTADNNKATGTEAVRAFFDDLRSGILNGQVAIDGHEFSEMTYLLNFFDLILRRLNELDLESVDRDLLYESIKMLFRNKFDTRINLANDALIGSNLNDKDVNNLMTLARDIQSKLG